MKNFKESRVIYLTSPYSDPQFIVRENRFQKVCEMAGRLTLERFIIFSPIAMFHSIAEIYPELEAHFNLWKKTCYFFLSKCDELWIYRLSGYNQSKRIAQEINWARGLELNIEFIQETKESLSNG